MKRSASEPGLNVVIDTREITHPLLAQVISTSLMCNNVFFLCRQWLSTVKVLWGIEGMKISRFLAPADVH